MHSLHHCEFPFPLAGEGVVLRFRTIDLSRLRSIYGDDHRKAPGRDTSGRIVDAFWDVLLSRIDAHDPTVIVDCLRHGLKQQDGKTEFKGLDLDDLPFALDAAAPYVADALLLARWGMTSGELAARMREEVAAARRDGDEVDPTLGSEPETISSSF